MRVWFWPIVLMSTFTVGAGIGSAQEQTELPTITQGTQIVSGFFGGQFFDLANTFEDFDNEAKNVLGFGARYQYQVTNRFGLEGGLLMSPGEHALFTADGGVVGDRDVDASYWTGNGVWNFRQRGRFYPFVTGGIGLARLGVDDPGLEETQTSFLWNFGGGLMFAATENVMLRFDVRDYIYTLDELDAEFRQALRLPIAFDETVNDLSVSIGASYVF